MKYLCSLDVSLKTTSICILEKGGKIVNEGILKQNVVKINIKMSICCIY